MCIYVKTKWIFALFINNDIIKLRIVSNSSKMIKDENKTFVERGEHNYEIKRNTHIF